MSSIFRRIEISPFFLILALLFLISGLFEHFIIFTSIIIVHELGHIVVGLLQKDKFVKIKLYIAGGIVTLDGNTEKSFLATLLILVAGFISQTIYFYIATILFNMGLMNYTTFNIFETYYFAILLFNLIPIVPLDGGLILRLILSKFVSYYQALRSTIIFSYFAIFFGFLYLYFVNFEISLIYIFLMLTYLLYLNSKNNLYTFNKFLIKRLNLDNKYQANIMKNSDVKSLKLFKNNYAVDKKQIIDEKTIIKNHFNLL